MPSLFVTGDPSKPLGDDYARNFDNLGHPVDGNLRRFERLGGTSHKISAEGLVSTATATRASDTISETVALENIQVRNEIDVEVAAVQTDAEERGNSVF